MSDDAFRSAVGFLPAALHKLGFQTLRPGQDRVVFNLFAGKSVFCILPTGQGKSACYILPTICCQYRTLIFSPLISLMQDQVEQLWKLNLSAGQLSSGQTPAENNATIAQWMSGQLQFLLVAPERLDNADFNLAINHVRPDLIVVDEAHCISQWSDSFRHHYAQLGDFSDRVKPKSLLLLTATAPDDVEQDVRRVMHAETAERVLYYPQRRNLVLSSKTYVGDHDILNFVNSIDGATIVYCSTVKKTEEMYAALCHHCKGRALVYNGTMKPDERATNQTMFMNGDVRVMFATKAFGLGINKANIRGVIHRDIPGSIDDLAQEMGRAGRDGLESQCRLFFEAKTYDTQKWFIDTAYPERSVITAVFRSIQSHLDDAGICKVTIENLSRHAGCQSAYCDSAIGILASSGVIDRNFDAGKIATVKLRKPHAEEECAFVMSTIERIGVKNGEGFDFNLETLIDVSGLKQKKVTDLLKLLDKEGYLTYIPPFRGKPTRIIGSLDMVDFDRIKVKRAAGMTKLNRVIHYHDTPDAKKHDFLQTYFGVKDSET